ncbi:MAG: flagellar biosynthesis protein FlhA [Nitrospinae bacterium]|nr:flagellar biosynthesis protein FlhA [Nitrospinota bacterium]
MASPDTTNQLALPGFAKFSDVLMAGAMIGIIALLVLPLPAHMLDLLLALSITISMIIMMMAIYTKSALEFASFPSVLLVVTIFRLALNVATTRLVLMHGNEGTSAAGKVIESFGNFVVGGNYVVGTVIFLILIIINFVVITKGAVRTSEVAARFTLDAIPGKQMSIDADLNAGNITEVQARERRRNLEREADFYGAMDGAIRFVRGDAIAGLIITAINVLGGFAIGVLQQGMSMNEAVLIYTLLTIGDGLVSQIPALVISVSAGLIVTRASSESDMGTDVARQVLVHPKAFAIASATLAFLGAVPGLPHLAFFFLSFVTGLIAYLTIEAEKEMFMTKKAEAEKAAQAPPSDKIESITPLDAMELEIGYELIPLVDAAQNGELLDRIKSVRKQFALDYGFIVPPLHIRDNLQLKANEYAVLLKGVKIAGGELVMNQYLAMDPGTGVDPVPGVATTEPAFGLPALWVTEANKERARSAGYTVVDVATVLTTHIKEIIRSNGHELLGRQEVNALIDNFKLTSPKIVEDLIPTVMTLGLVQKVLQNLLKEQISIRDLGTILETLSDCGGATKDTDILSEYCRQALARQITRQYVSPNGKLPAITLSKRTEDMVQEAIKQTQHGSYLAMDPTAAQKLVDGLKKEMERASSLGFQPVVMTAPAVRLHLRRLIERFVPNVATLSYNEVTTGTEIETLGVVGV